MASELAGEHSIENAHSYVHHACRDCKSPLGETIQIAEQRERLDLSIYLHGIHLHGECFSGEDPRAQPTPTQALQAAPSTAPSPALCPASKK